MHIQSNFIYSIINNDLKFKTCTTIHTRFPPEPNGYLHLGHAKSICLNFGIAQSYQGKCNLRFDDTNPDKEHKEYIDAIKYDIQWLGFKWNGKTCYVSDYFQDLYRYAVLLIKKGLAYVDELSIYEIRKYRGTLITPGKNSPYRYRTVQENLNCFYKMRDGFFDEGGACLRAKIDMSASSIVMRDPVLYRIKYTTHYRTGTKWCIYPTYDFSHCISDTIEGITHSLCTLEFQDNRVLYNWILKNINIKQKYPVQYEFARLNLEYVITSKRKLNILILKKIVDGWDDPRMPTIAGLRRRGYTSKSIREFCQRIGTSKQDSKIELSVLESCIRNDLNKNALRLMAVINPVKIVIINFPEGYSEQIIAPNHPNYCEMGTRKIIFDRELFIDRADFYEKSTYSTLSKLMLGKEIRLRYAYIIKAEFVEKDNDGKIICIYCSYDSSTLNRNPTNGRKIYGVIHWVSALNNIKSEFRLYEKLFIHPNPNSIKNLLSIVNPKSLIKSCGFIEQNLSLFNNPGPYQFEREGYFIVDIQLSKSTYLVFNRTITLKRNQ